jgi:hypothetical protein
MKRIVLRCAFALVLVASPETAQGEGVVVSVVPKKQDFAAREQVEIVVSVTNSTDSEVSIPVGYNDPLCQIANLKADEVFIPILALPNSAPVEPEDFAVTLAKDNLITVPPASRTTARFVVTSYLTVSDFWTTGSPSIRHLVPGDYRLICGHSRSAKNPDFRWDAPIGEIFSESNTEPFKVQ